MTKTTGKNVFIIGPGLIGWNVLELLVEEGYNVSGLVRRDSHGKQIKRSGASPIQGDLNDHDLIVEHVTKNDVSSQTGSAV
jgi:nucleoside-diphosphate-sugar epimerase